MRGNVLIKLREPTYGEPDAYGQRPVTWTEHGRSAIRTDRRGTRSESGDVLVATWLREYDVRPIGLDVVPGWQIEDIEEARIYTVTSVSRPMRRVRRITLSAEALD